MLSILGSPNFVYLMGILDLFKSIDIKWIQYMDTLR